MTTKPRETSAAETRAPVEQVSSSAAPRGTHSETTTARSPAGDVKTTTETTTAKGDDGEAKSVKTTQHRPGGGSETRTDTVSRATATCVVDDGTRHTGRAVPGTVVCSAHTIRYHNDGTPRDPSQTGQAPAPREVRHP